MLAASLKKIKRVNRFEPEIRTPNRFTRSSLFNAIRKNGDYDGENAHILFSKKNIVTLLKRTKLFCFQKKKKGVKLSYVHMFVFLYFVFSRFHLMERNPNPDLRNILRSRWGYSPINL